jgi:hypothetical protein
MAPPLENVNTATPTDKPLQNVGANLLQDVGDYFSKLNSMFGNSQANDFLASTNFAIGNRENSAGSPSC